MTIVAKILTVLKRNQVTEPAMPIPPTIECFAYVSGISTEPVKTLISAKELPVEGEAIRVLCKWPRRTAKGWSDNGDYWWAVVSVVRGKVFVMPTCK